MPHSKIDFKCAVEGPTDETVLRRILDYVGVKVGKIYGRKGKDYIKGEINAFNNSAKSFLWVVLIDLDNEEDCAPAYKKTLLPTPSHYMCFRIAVHEIEAWLLADREHLSEFLKVNVSRIPLDPETILDPKRQMVELGRLSSRKAIREDMVPRPGSGRSIGPAYNSRLTRFVLDEESGWRPEVAMQSSDSLRRCINCISRKVEAFR